MFTSDTLKLCEQSNQRLLEIVKNETNLKGAEIVK